MRFFTLQIIGLLILGSPIVSAQPPAGQPDKPTIIGWNDDNSYVVLTYENKIPVYKSVDVRKGSERILTEYKSDTEKLLALLPSTYVHAPGNIISPDNRSVIIARNNDLFYVTPLSSEEVRLTNNPDEEVNTRFSPDSKKLAYTRNKDLYVFDLISMKEVRLTDDATDKIYNGYASWVYFEEILGRPSRYAAFWWSPNSEKIAYLHTDDTPVPDFTLVRLDQADGVNGKTEVTPYPKPGNPNPEVKMGIADLATGKTTWVQTNNRIDQYIAWPFWTPDSKSLAVQVMNRDQNDIKIFLANANSGHLAEIYHEARPTWVDFFEDIYVMKNGTGFLVRSYRSDWENLYYYDWSGKLKTQITSLNFRVTSIERVDESAGVVYFAATGAQSTDKHFYKVGLDGKDLLQLTSSEGTHSISISPKGSYIIDTWNNLNDPGAIAVIDKSGKQLREIYRTPVMEFDPGKNSRAEMVKIKTSDGLFDMPAIIKYPVNFDESKKYPVVFTIYGGPDAGRVFNVFPGTNPDWYAMNGIITISVDHRASGKFGKKGLDYMHRNLGKWEILDYADAVKWLRTKPFVDASRMGITGGSYGGYMTCLALTKGSEYWTHGVANSSVTDWKLYDNVYTERYMDEPKNNITGYNDGSVMTYAENLSGKLLMTHGDVDDNVHMQNTIHLISKFQDLSKNFEFMIFPGQRHGFVGTKRAYSTKLANEFWLKEFFGN